MEKFICSFINWKRNLGGYCVRFFFIVFVFFFLMFDVGCKVYEVFFLDFENFFWVIRVFSRCILREGRGGGWRFLDFKSKMLRIVMF